MAKPQPEDGTVRIARELYTAIVMAPFSKRELKIVLAWIRVGYGWRKKETGLSKTFLAEYTKISLPHIGVTLTALLDRNVFQEKEGKIRLNKNYEEWDFGDSRLPKREVVRLNGQSKNQEVTKTVTKMGSRGYQNGKLRLPKREVKVTKTVSSTAATSSKSKTSKALQQLQRSKEKKFPRHSDIDHTDEKHRASKAEISSIVHSAVQAHISEKQLNTFLKKNIGIEDISELPKARMREVCLFITKKELRK